MFILKPLILEELEKYSPPIQTMQEAINNSKGSRLYKNRCKKFSKYPGIPIDVLLWRKPRMG